MSQNAVESGSGTVSISNINLRIKTQEDNQHIHNANKPDRFNFLDYLNVSTQPVLTISDLTCFKLQNFLGHNVVTDIVFRSASNVAAASGAYRNYISLGRQAQLNYYNGQNKPLLGGSTLDADESRLLLGC